MDRDKKRSSTSSQYNDPISLSTMASSYYRPNGATSARNISTTRPSTPPASTYFTTFDDNDQEPIPTANAQSHFAYSTTLRRHPTELTSPNAQHFHLPPVEGFVNQVLGAVGGERWQRDIEAEPLRNGGPPSHSEGTSSSRFAHLSIEVRSSWLGSFSVFSLLTIFSRSIGCCFSFSHIQHDGTGLSGYTCSASTSRLQ